MASIAPFRCSVEDQVIKFSKPKRLSLVVVSSTKPTRQRNGSKTRNRQDLPQNGTSSPPDFDAATVAPYQSQDGYLLRQQQQQQQLHVLSSTPKSATTTELGPCPTPSSASPKDPSPTFGNPSSPSPGHAAKIRRQDATRVSPAEGGIQQPGQQTTSSFQPSPQTFPADAASAGTPGRLGTAEPSSAGEGSGRRYGTTSTCAAVVRRIISKP